MSGLEAIRRGEDAEREGDFLQASAAYEAARDDPDPLVAGDAHFHLGRAAWRQGRFDVAIAAFEAARAIALQHGADTLRAQTENGIGAVHYARGEYAQARAAYDVALAFTSDPVMRAKIQLNLGVIANIEGDLPTARAMYARSRSVFREAGDTAFEALALYNLGMLHADQREWDEADEAYRLTLDVCEARGDRQMLANVLVNRSEVSSGRGRHDDAIAGCDRALTIYVELGDEVGRGEALRWKGHALRLLGRPGASERVLLEAVRSAQRTQVLLLEAEASREIGEIMVERRDALAARTWLSRALELFEKLGAAPDIADTREALLSLESDSRHDPRS